MSAPQILPTCDVPVFFATTEGQTRRIAEHLAAVLRDQGFDSRAIDLGGRDATHIDWSRARGALVGASLHAGKHQPEITRFVHRYVAELNARPTAFFSVSLSAASKSARGRDAAQKIADAFPAALGWSPWFVTIVAGCLAYTKYGFLKRWMMKRIARKEGGPTDTSRDYELTNWDDVETLAGMVAKALRLRSGQAMCGQDGRRGSSAA